MQQTTNYKLNKPEASDYADIKPVSDNMDIIDTELKKAQNHREDSGIHVTASEKQEWNGKAPGSLVHTVSDHTGNGNIHVTAQDKQKWNGYKTVIQLSHQKSGNVHQLTGLGSSSGTVSAVFTATAAYTAGDTFTVDGTAYTVQLSNGETAEDNLFVTGAAVPIVLDTAGKKVNFKAAGGQKLPAGSLAIVKIFTANGTFTVPQTGNYRVTVIGPGGKGGYAAYTNDSGFGGGAGGAAQVVRKLSKGESFPVTVSEAAASFGSLASATAGKNGGKYDEGPGTGGTAAGDTHFQGGSGKSKSDYIQKQGTDGGCYTSEQAAVMAALSETGGKGGDQEDGKIPCTVSKAGFAPFGCGGGGGGYQYAGTAGDWSGRRDGGEGFGGAVIIELVL